MAILGYNTIGSNPLAIPANFAQVGGAFLGPAPFLATQSGTILDVQMYVDNGSSFNQVIRGVVYTDNAGVPGTLVTTGAEVTIVNPQSAGWIVSAASGSITSGLSYWIGFEAGATNNSARMYGDTGSSGAGYFLANTYPTAPATFAGASAFSQVWSVFIDYTPTGTSPPVSDAQTLFFHG